MPNRTSIELHPSGCRLVEVQVSPKGKDTAATDVRVRTFVTGMPPAEDVSALSGRLSSLRQEQKLARNAWITVWGLRTAQQFLRLPPAKPADLEGLAIREARKEISAIETNGDRASVGIIVGGEVQVGPHRRREVSLVAVSSEEVRRRIQPVIDAGFVVDGVLTPALALSAIARAQRDVLPGTAAAYVAIAAQATCLAIVRDGVLLFAREMPWGHVTEGNSQDAIAARLASELRRSVLFFKQTFRAAVEHVILCGDMPNLRALTGPLGATLTIDVQTLDSLVGIDAAALPEPAEAFRADVAALRMAIAAGAEAQPPANVLPSAIRVTREARTQLVRLVASVAASVVLIGGWYALEQRGARTQRNELAELQQQIQTLGPEADRRAAVRATSLRSISQSGALTAFETQGPRLARILEVLSQAAPTGVVLTGVTADAQGAQWVVTISGVAIAEDAAASQGALNELLRVVGESPFLGETSEPPSLRVVSGKVSTASAATRDVPIPEWASAVEFGLRFMVEK